jgi:hypothetical protein
LRRAGGGRWAGWACCASWAAKRELDWAAKRGALGCQAKLDQIGEWMG